MIKETTVSLGACVACGKMVLAGDFVLLARSDFEQLNASSPGAVGRETGPISYPRALVAREPEIAAFIVAELPGKTVKDVVVATRQRFGARAPSKSAIYRFVASLRRAPGAAAIG